MNRKKTHELGQEALSKGFPGGSVVKYLPSMQEMWVRSLGREDPLEKKMTTPLQYSCLGNPTDRGTWQATVHEVTKESDTTKQQRRWEDLHESPRKQRLWFQDAGPVGNGWLQGMTSPGPVGYRGSSKTLMVSFLQTEGSLALRILLRQWPRAEMTWNT